MKETIRYNHKTLPFSFEGWDEAGDVGDIQFYNVEFNEDFGPFQKGDKCSCVARMDADGSLIEYDNNGVTKRSIKIKYIAL